MEASHLQLPAGSPKPVGEDRSAKARWTDRLGEPFCPVSSYFLANYHRLAPHPGADGLSSTEAMLVIQLMDHKWSKKAPYPTLKRLSKRMGLSTRTLRDALHRLGDDGLKLIRRQYSVTGGPTRYHFDGLFAALERLMDDDEAEYAAAMAAEYGPPPTQAQVEAERDEGEE